MYVCVTDVSLEKEEEACLEVSKKNTHVYRKRQCVEQKQWTGARRRQKNRNITHHEGGRLKKDGRRF